MISGGRIAPAMHRPSQRRRFVLFIFQVRIDALNQSPCQPIFTEQCCPMECGLSETKKATFAGYVPLAEVGAEFLFQVVADRAEKAAVIVTTNLPLSEWTQVIPKARLCKALLDRITDRAHILETGTESYRFRRTINKHKKGPKTAGPSQLAVEMTDGGKPGKPTKWAEELASRLLCKGPTLQEGMIVRGQARALRRERLDIELLLSRGGLMRQVFKSVF